MTKYIAPCVLFMFNNEILSLIALCVIGVVFIGNILAARERCSQWQ